MKFKLHPRLVKYVSVFLMLFFCSTIAKSQASFLPGYILTNTNDTLKGLIDFRNNDKNSKVCTFKNSASGEITSYSPGDIKEYRFKNGKYFVSKEVKNKELFFLEYMVNGITDLYYYWNEGPHYLVEKSNGEILELTNEEKLVFIDGKQHLHKTNYFRGILKVTFQDCPQIFPLIDKASLENKSLTDITKTYHKYMCDDEKCIIYENKLPLSVINFAPTISADYSLLKTDVNQKFPSTYDPAVSPSVGLSMRVSFPRWNNKFTVIVGNSFGVSKFKKHDEFLILNTPSVCDASINATFLETSFAIKYIIPATKFSPTLQIGFNNNLYLNWDAKSHAVATYNGYTTVYDFTEGPFDKSLKGIVAGGGIEKKLKNSHIWFVDLTATYNVGRYNESTANQDIYTKNSLIATGITSGIYF